MRILVTGSTGMVGSHICKALAAAGHSVCAMVRDEDRARTLHNQVGVGGIDYALGDITDETSIERSIEGCDAVVHAAAMILFDPKRLDEMTDTNVGGTRRVLEIAHERGLDPIVQVSSIAALWSAGGEPITEQTPVASPNDTYSRTKAEAEEIARKMQDAGAPVVCIYPGAVWGPDNPTLGDQITTIFAMVRWGYYLSVFGGMPIIDARDLAEAVTRTMTPGLGPRRFVLSGWYQSHDDMRRLISKIRGRKLFRLAMPAWLLLLVGRVGDLLQSLGIDTGAIRYESVRIGTSGLRADDSHSLATLGLELRPIEETVEAQMRWMHAHGHLKDRHVGALAAQTNG
ncbi:MAG: SDR family NAD(P)-dependent oxidoreductase [Myxococcota bacterium]|nr:SDR family NAD(P)-dependent oxidoreductase [Myxococcota bacterium]